MRGEATPPSGGMMVIRRGGLSDPQHLLRREVLQLETVVEPFRSRGDAEIVFVNFADQRHQVRGVHNGDRRGVDAGLLRTAEGDHGDILRNSNPMIAEGANEAAGRFNRGAEDGIGPVELPRPHQPIGIVDRVNERGLGGSRAVIPDHAGATVLGQSPFPRQLTRGGAVEIGLHREEVDAPAAALVEKLHQMPDCFDVDSVETADAIAGQVVEERDHPVAAAAEFLQQEWMERADVEENYIEILIQRLVNHRILAVAEGDILITAPIFTGGSRNGVAPLVGEGDGALVEIGDPQFRRLPRRAGNLQPPVRGPDHDPVVDQLLHRLPGGHVADPELLHQLGGSRQRAGKVISMRNSALEYLGDLYVFWNPCHSKLHAYNFISR